MPIYFDHAATTKVCPEAADAALRAMTQDFGNPSSRHALGTAAAAALAAHRADVATALGCLPEEIYFTAGGTEADNWAIEIMKRLSQRKGKHIVTTAVEHSAVLEPVKALEAEGYEVSYLPTDREGRITPAQVEEALRPDTAFVSMMLVNNETGVCFPVAETARLIKERCPGALLHSDAVQGFTKLPFTPETLGVDLLSISAHKLGGMKGSGALFIRKGLKASPMILGGGQEQGLRSGTEGTAQIAAFAAACRVGQESREARREAIRALKEATLARLQADIPTFVVVSEGDAPHICAISLPGYPSEMLVRELSDRGICVSSGSACHKGKPSRVFAAMKLAPKIQMGVLRLSFSFENTMEEVDALCTALAAIVRERVPAKR